MEKMLLLTIALVFGWSSSHMNSKNMNSKSRVKNISMVVIFTDTQSFRRFIFYVLYVLYVNSDVDLVQ